jgi:hypothetical protein
MTLLERLESWVLRTLVRVAQVAFVPFVIGAGACAVFVRVFAEVEL